MSRRVHGQTAESFFEVKRVKCKGHPFTGTEALYGPYGP